MEKTTYQILRKNISNVELVGLTSQSWYDSTHTEIAWSSSVYDGPSQYDVVYNITGSIPTGSYIWTGTTWTLIPESSAYLTYNLPIFLESKVDELGVMVGFDGDIEQVEQLCNFSYTQTGSTIQIYNTDDPTVLRKIVEQTFTIDWGDGNTDNLPVNYGIIGVPLPTITHTYSIPSGYTITIYLSSPWTNQKLERKVLIPQDLVVLNPFGTFTGLTIPAYGNLTGQTQDYLNDYDYMPGYTGFTAFTYIALGQSRISELKKYGEDVYSGVTGGTDTIGIYSAYTIDGLYYKDYSDGYTMITGNTSGYTKEDVINTVITRNEHFLGFVDEPTIYSDVFIERGKQSVMERNLRLGEIENIGEFNIYGNGYFTVKKQ
jgi:hypothetical protein